MRFNKTPPKQLPWNMEGGVDLATSQLRLNPGALINCLNYEVDVDGAGYRRIDGYERYDGRPAPSEASYWILNYDTGDTTKAFAIGDGVFGGTTAHSGLVIAVGTVEVYGTSPQYTRGFLVLVNVTGTFQDGEDLEVNLVRYASADGIAEERAAGTVADDRTYLDLAIANRRSIIGAIPGSGPVRGVVTINDTRYGMRDNAGATAGTIFRATVGGWAEIDYGAYLDFTLGTAVFTLGDTVTGAVSTETGKVVAIDVQSGTWGAGTAAGRLWLNTISGTFQAEVVTGAISGSATASGAQTAPTIPAGGRYEFDVKNFFGTVDYKRIYGVNGVGKAVILDDDGGFAQIFTGATIDTPTHVIEFAKYLFIAYPGGSWANSDIGDPFLWSGLGGANEIGTGDETVGFQVIGTTLVGWDRNQIYKLDGLDPANWNLLPISQEAGAIEWTIQDIATPRYFDDRGLTTLQTTQAFGDFKHSAFSTPIDKWLMPRKSLAVASSISKDLNQYRLFFSDNVVLYVTFKGEKVIGFTFCRYEDPVRCAWASEDTDGNEILYAGSDDGWVFQLNRGTSFDGEDLEYYLQTAFHHYKSPQFDKSFHRAFVDVETEGDATIEIGAEFGFGGQEYPSSPIEESDASGPGGRWDVSLWDAFYWDLGGYYSNVTVPIDGTAPNMSLIVYGKSCSCSPHTVKSAVVEYTLRARLR